VQDRPGRQRFTSRPEGSNANVTSAIGMEETAGRLRAQHQLLFTRTVMWITGLICTAFLLGTLAQAWSNNHLAQQVQQEQQSLQQVRDQNTHLKQAADYYKDPAVVESEARQQLGYIRPGEHAVIIIGADDQQQHNTQPTKPAPQQQGHWQDWWNIFF